MTFWAFLKSLPAFIMFLLILSVLTSILAYAGGIYWAVSQGMEVEFGDYGLPKRIGQVEPGHIKGCRELREAYAANVRSLSEQNRSNTERISSYQQSISDLHKLHAEALRYNHENSIQHNYSYTSQKLQEEITALEYKRDAVYDVENELQSKEEVQYKNLVTMCWAVLQPAP